MELLIVRHARAEDREAFAATGAEDARRPLTGDGRKRMREVARALTALVPHIEGIATSPYIRAAQTAQLIADRYALVPEPLDALAPGHPPEAVLPWLGGVRAEAAVAAVGHEPDLGRLASWLLAGPGADFMPFKKGGACLLRFEGEPGPGRAELRWCMAPAQLRRLKVQ